jgi:hypothetical protein
MSENSQPGGIRSVPSRPLLEGEIRPPQGGILRPFQKGHSGNPGGTPVSAYHAARRICAQATEEAARIQVQLMRDPDSRVAYMATEAVLKRGAGTPRDHSAEDDAATRVDLNALSADERKTLVTLLRRALGEK